MGKRAMGDQKAETIPVPHGDPSVRSQVTRTPLTTMGYTGEVGGHTRAVGLNPAQQRFVYEYLIDRHAGKAAMRAGYSARTAHMQGSRLLKNETVCRAIASELERLGRCNHVTVESVTAELEAARRLAIDENKIGVAVAAIMAKAKLHGLMVNRHQLSADMTLSKIERIIVRPENTNG